MKFGRTYIMTIEGVEDTHRVQFPLTCRFKVSNSGTPSASLATFDIYNLSPDVRNDIYVDPFQTQFYRQVVFAAGYEREPSIPIIFRGNIYRCYSFRRGPDWVTHLECLDGGFAMENGDINLSIPSPYDFKTVIAQIVAGLGSTVKLGTVGNFSVPNARGVTFCGNPWDLLVRRILPLNGQVYINNEVVNVVQQREYIVNSTGFETISVETGLLDTPKKQDGIIHCRMIFEPRIEIMQKVSVQSLEPVNNGDFKVMRIDHMGTISGAVGESLTSEVTGFAPALSLQEVA